MKTAPVLPLPAVNKDEFDALLSRLLRVPLEKTATIKSEKKGGMIIPPKLAPARQ